MTWWVLTYSKTWPMPTSLRVRVKTNILDRLYMAWSYVKPSRTPIWRVIRGKRVHCGYRYIWDTPTIQEQNEEGETAEHTFDLEGLTPGSTIWYYQFAPDGPYDLEIQGPFGYIILPVWTPWPFEVYVATRLKGFFRTRTFSGPGTAQPTWKTFNDGLDSLHIWQLCPDPIDPAARHFCIAGEEGSRKLYRRRPSVSAEWVPVLTNLACRLLTLSGGGIIHWIGGNPHQPGHFYVLFNSDFFDNGTWCIRTTNYGTTWWAHRIFDGDYNYRCGNITTGPVQGTSPWPAGGVLYAALNTAFPLGLIFRSTDDGLTWINAAALIGFGATYPQILVDPTDQSILYIGIHLGAANPNELFRSPHHGASLAEVDGDHHLGCFLSPRMGDIWIWNVDHRWARVLKYRHVWETTDYCASWTDLGLCFHPADHFTMLEQNPDNVFFGRFSNTEESPFPHGSHVLHVSEDNGATMWGKAGRNTGLDDGGGNSIPWNCGGVSEQGIMPIPLS